MFRNYCKIIFRNLRKYKGYTLLNILGMGIGIAAMVWGYQSLQFSRSFDNFQKDPDHVYRVLTYKKDADGLRGIVPMPAVQMAKKDFAGVEEAVRWQGRGITVRYDTSETFSEYVHFADPAFFDLFHFPLVANAFGAGKDGAAGGEVVNIEKRLLEDPNTVLITEKMAKKYFGGKDPVGKVLHFYAGENYSKALTVKGVLQDVPVNSTLQFGMITHFDNLVKDDGTKMAPDDWSWYLGAAFLKIPDPANAALLEKEMAKYVPIQNKAREDAKVGAFKLISIRQAAGLRDEIASNDLFRRPDDAATYGPIVLAFLIFLSACLNFSNTTVAHAGRRLKEIGMRKVMGSTYRQLMAQVLAECSIIVLASIILSMLFNNWWLPVFNNMFQGVKLQADYLHDPHLLLFMGAMLLGATLLAGAYPAFYLSRFNPTSIFRGSVKFGGSNLFSRLMLGLQLSIAIITVTAALGFARNSEFQRNYDYGYNIESSIGVNLNDTTSFAALKNQLSSVRGITAISGTRHHIGFGYRNAIAESGGSKKEIYYLEVGREYPAVMGFKVTAGRGFNADMESDYNNAILISQKMAAMYSWTALQAVGKQIHIDNTYYSVVGVIKDFQSDNLFEPLHPTAIRLTKENQYRYLIVQANPRDLAGVFPQVKAAWKVIHPTRPFNGFYQNQIKADAYQATSSIATIFLWFGLISILLTATGLFALVSLTALKKMKEIALRKVVGASPGHILVLINKGYFWIFIISSFLGCYAGWALTRLLLDMIFKINAGVSMWSLVWSVIVLFVIAAFTSGIKVWQAVKTNPVKLLRSE
jgi:putative ABC transport system permease protein